VSADPEFRVLAHRDGEILLVDREDYEPLTAEASGAAVLPGFGVDADLGWGEPPELADLEVVDRTLLEFVDGATNLFEVALDTVEEARREGLGVNSRVTYGTDGDPNGALYAFADGPGSSVFREFRSGSRPLEPLIEQVDRDPPYEVFVLRPATRPFVLVYIVFREESTLADTVRETYGCPRPPKPE